MPDDAIHDRGTVVDDRADLLAVDQLGDRRAAVPDQARDLLQGDPVVGQQRNERVPQLPRSPIVCECLAVEGLTTASTRTSGNSLGRVSVLDQLRLVERAVAVAANLARRLLLTLRQQWSSHRCDLLDGRQR